MNKISGFFLATLLIFGLFGNVALSAEKDWSVDLTETNAIVSGFEQQTDVLALSVDEIIDELRVIDPLFVSFFESSALIQEDKKVNVLRSYLAYKTYQYYKNKYLAELKQRSQETGREIKSKQFETLNMKETFYWLDRGRLDEPECHLNGDVNEFSICKYPDGFEDFYVVFKTFSPTDGTIQNQVTNFMNEISGNSTTGAIISIVKDMPEKNVTLDMIIMIANDGQTLEIESENLYESFVKNSFSTELNVITSKYNEIHEWRNQEVADTLAGKHDVLYTEETSRGTRIHERQEEDMSAWKSNWLPAAKVNSIDFLLNSTNNQAKNK